MIPRWLADPPLDPTPDEARSWLRRELLRPEYQQESPLQRIWDWIQQTLLRAVDAASSVGPVVTAVAMLIFALLAVGLTLLLTRARRTRRTAVERRPVFGDRRLGAAELRDRARAALAGQRYDDALVEAFRALTARQIERGLLDDLPGATAHEVAVALEAAYPGREADLAHAAFLFDLVLYGDRPATREQAESVLALDDGLVGAR